MLKADHSDFFESIAKYVSPTRLTLPRSFFGERATLAGRMARASCYGELLWEVITIRPMYLIYW